MFRASARHFETHSVSGRCPLVQIASRPLASVVSIDAALASPPHGPGSHVDVRAKIAHWLGATNANVAHSDEHGRIASALRMEWIASRAASGITTTVDCPTDDGKGVVDMADAELTFTLLPKAVRESLMEPVRAACLRVEDGLCGTLGPRSVATDAWLDEAASAAHATWRTSGEWGRGLVGCWEWCRLSELLRAVGRRLMRIVRYELVAALSAVYAAAGRSVKGMSFAAFCGSLAAICKEMRACGLLKPAASMLEVESFMLLRLASMRRALYPKVASRCEQLDAVLATAKKKKRRDVEPLCWYDAAAVLREVQRDGETLRWAFPAQRANKTIVLAALASAAAGRIPRGAPSPLRWADPTLQDNAEVVRVAVQDDGRALEFASARLTLSRDVVFAAVRSAPLALKFAHPDLIRGAGDKAIATAAAAAAGGPMRLVALAAIVTGTEGVPRPRPAWAMPAAHRGCRRRAKARACENEALAAIAARFGAMSPKALAARRGEPTGGGEAGQWRTADDEAANI